jgi:hypothetical protein
MIGQSQSIHAVLFGSFDQLADRTGSVEQAVMTVTVEMSERPVVHDYDPSLRGPDVIRETLIVDQIRNLPTGLDKPFRQ